MDDMTRRESSPTTVRVRQMLTSLYEGRFRKNRTHLAEAVGLSVAGVLRIMEHGGNPGPVTAARIYELMGYDRMDYFRDEYDLTPEYAFPNLDIAVAFEGQSRWSRPTLAAARAGLWLDDCEPKAWVSRLDGLQHCIDAMMKKDSPPG